MIIITTPVIFFCCSEKPYFFIYIILELYFKIKICRSTSSSFVELNTVDFLLTKMSLLWFWVSFGDGSEPAWTLQKRYISIYQDLRPSISLKIEVKKRKKQLKDAMASKPHKALKTQPRPTNPLDKIAAASSSSTVKLDEIPKEKERQTPTPTVSAPAEMRIVIERPSVSIWKNNVAKGDILKWVQSSAAVLNIVNYLRKKTAMKRVITVFLSSPFFDGMEQERSIFRGEKYATQLEDLCAKKGFLLKFVDMRFGITREVADNHETVMTCLRGLDEADVFLGFFGARYGTSTLNRKVLATGVVKEAINEISIRTEETIDPGILPRANRVFLRLSKSSSLEYLCKSYDPVGRVIQLSGGGFGPGAAPQAGDAYEILESTGDWLLADLEAARESYPFLDDMTDKSVTEFEFQHGYLLEQARVIICSGVTPSQEKEKSFVSKMAKFFAQQTSKVAPSLYANVAVVLASTMPPYSVHPGMRLSIQGLPPQHIMEWDEDTKLARVSPGYREPISSGMNYTLSIPKRLCVSLFRSEDYDNKQAALNPAQAYKWSVENDKSREALRSLVDTLKECAKSEESAVFDGYADPNAAADVMYNFLKFNNQGKTESSDQNLVGNFKGYCF